MTFAQSPDSNETISPAEHSLTYQPSPGAPDRRNLWAASVEENTGSTCSPDFNEIRSSSKPRIL